MWLNTMWCLKNQILVVKEILSRCVFGSKSVAASLKYFFNPSTSVQLHHCSCQACNPPTKIITSPLGFVFHSSIFHPLQAAVLYMLTQNLLGRGTSH